MEGVKQLARRYHAYLFKCDPCILATDSSSIENMQNMGLTFQKEKGGNTIQCCSNYMLDLENKRADEVFDSFHSKWRYNIRLAERKGVVCKYFEKDTLEGKMDDFYPLMQETGNRDGFYIRSKEYLTSMINHLGPHCRLYLCYYQDHPVSGAIATQYAGKTCYVYGASSDTARNAMPNYIMQWHMIQWAIDNKNTIYDFQGIPYYNDETHPNYGVYRFKKGFNGQIVEYAGEFDYLFSPTNKKLIDRFYQVSKILQFKKSQLCEKLHK
jgi:lipid II:glycine glycyltransferase (peptidoglycan interpeptide bridge formation enzyme)